MKDTRKWGGMLGLVALLLCACARPSAAWNDDGHKLVAEVAYGRLTAQARKNVDFLLSGTTLDRAAVWPDAMRTWQRNPTKPEPAALAGDPQAALFFRDPRNAAQPSWHFVDIPNGTADYAHAPVGTGPDDIVHALRRCLAVLQGHPPPGEYLNPPQALRLLIHYVGDLHQPLHAASGDWVGDGPQNANGFRLASRAEAKAAASDRGGNGLHYGPGKFENLHGFWDYNLVDLTAAGTPEDFAAHRTRLQTAANALGRAPCAAPGYPQAWPEQWANESARAAARAYAAFGPVRNGVVTPDPRGGQPTFTADITLPLTYQAQFKPVADARLALAGFRLAAALNATLSDRDLAAPAAPPPPVLKANRGKKRG